MPALATLGIYYAAGWTITTQMVVLAIFEAISIAYLASQSARLNKPDESRSGASGALVNTRSSQEPLPVLYGRHRVGGNQVYINSTGENNKYLHIIMTLSEGPIEGIEELYLDEKPASEYGSLVYYEFFNGAGDQAICQTLKNADAGWDDYLRWTAYLYIRLEYNAEQFSGLPKITAIAKGRKLYDPRSGVTAYSNNPALVVYDWLTSRRYGLGLDSSFVDSQSIIDAANWYESQTYPYTFNGVVTNRQSFLDNLGEILLNGRADIIWGGGKYKLLVRKYDTPVMSLTEDDIMAESFTFSVPGLADTPNRVIIKYPDETNTDYPNWIGSSAYDVGDRIAPTTPNGFYYECTDPGTTGGTEPVWPKTKGGTVADGGVIWTCYPADLGWMDKEQVIEDSDSVLLHDGEERDLELKLVGTTNAEQANLLGTYNLERARLNKAFMFTVHSRCLALEPGDMIQVTHSLVGWTNRVVRVMDVRLSQDGAVGLTVQEEDAALYDDTLNLSPHSYFQTNLPNPLDTVPEATGVSFVEEEYFNKDTSYTRLKVTFTPPASPFWDYSEVWVNVDNNGYNHYTNARGSFAVEPVKEGVSYKVKLLSVSLQNVRQGISTATEWTYAVVGKNTPPADITNFRALPQSDSVVLMWDAVNAVDLQGYEIRRGTNWSGGIFLGFTRAVSYPLNGVAPGTHSYMVKSVDTNGRYSNGYALASAVVYGPAAYTEKMSELNQFQNPAAWQASTAKTQGNKVFPTTPNGYYYICTVAGTTGGTEPTWPTTNGNTVTDGGVTWKALQAQSFTTTEAYNDPVNGWELYVIHGSDEFGVGSKQDIKTGGDGAKRHGWQVLNSGNADAIDAHTTNAGLLTIDCNATNADFANSTFSGVFIFKEFAGDFDVEVDSTGSNQDADSESVALIARDPTASAGEDWFGVLSGYRSGTFTVWSRNTVNSVTTGLNITAVTQRFLRLTRVGAVLTSYRKAAAGDAWIQVSQVTRNDFGTTVQVGVGAATGNTSNNFVAKFDYFRKANGNLSGSYLSPVYDRGSNLTRRSWPSFDHAFEGTGSTWADQFGATDLWTDVFGASDTWLYIFGAYIAGTVRMKFAISTDGTSWTWFSNFESFALEAQGRYVRYKVEIDDASAEGYLHTGEITYKEAYV